MPMHRSSSSSSHQGFVILFVVLIASIILLIGAGIFTISFKQNILSSTARESQLAFAAADSAVECTLYYDRLGAISLTGTGFSCAGVNITPTSLLGSTEFGFDIPFQSLYGGTGDNLPCARVEINKDFNQNAVSYTRILARGYNTCLQNGTPALDNPLLLERVLEVKYVNPVVTGGVVGGQVTTGPGASASSNPSAGSQPSGGTGSSNPAGGAGLGASASSGQ